MGSECPPTVSDPRTMRQKTSRKTRTFAEPQADSLSAPQVDLPQRIFVCLKRALDLFGREAGCLGCVGHSVAHASHLPASCYLLSLSPGLSGCQSKVRVIGM